MQVFAQLEIGMNAVERQKYYSELKSENYEGKTLIYCGPIHLLVIIFNHVPKGKFFNSTVELELN